MKRIFTLIALFTITSLGANAQFSFTVRKTPRFAVGLDLGGHQVSWNNPSPAALAATDNSTIATSPAAREGEYSDFLAMRDFGFAIPASATISSIEVIITRQERGSFIKDNRLRLTKFGLMVGFDLANTSDEWPTNDDSAFYGVTPFGSLWGESWTPAEINAADFGLNFAIMRLGGGGGGGNSAVVNQVQIRVTYLMLFPIVLSNFDVKLVGDKVAINFTTESETKVKTLFIERSSDGRNYSDLITIQPKGGENIRTTYNLTDAAPLLGTNYYRLKEIDIDGKWHYYDTRMIITSSTANKFQAYQNGANVMVNFNNLPGAYTATLMDMNGAIVAKQSFKVDRQSVQISLSPTVTRTGLYLVNLKGGEGFNQSVKVFIQR